MRSMALGGAGLRMTAGEDLRREFRDLSDGSKDAMPPV